MPSGVTTKATLEETGRLFRRGRELRGLFAEEIVLRRELVVDPSRPAGDRGSEPEEDRAGYEEDRPRRPAAVLLPQEEQDQRRDDVAEVVRDVEQGEGPAAEVVGHRLLRDRVRGDLPQEEREEAD